MARIHEAIRKGDVGLTERLLRGGFLRRPADANQKDRESGETPLGIAAGGGLCDLAKLLLEKGAMEMRLTGQEIVRSEQR